MRGHPFLQYDYKFGTDYYNFLIKQKGGGLKVKFEDYIFYIDEIKYDNCIKIFIGNPDKDEPECVHIRIDDEFPEIANLIFFQYDEKCSINKMLKKGEGTKVMFKTIVKYIKKFYTNVKMIDLSDTAKISCYYNGSLTKFKLYKWYLFLYGKGYYQKNYGFDFENRFKKEKHIENVRIIKTLKVNLREVFDILKKLELSNKEIYDFIRQLKNNELWCSAIKRIRDENLLNDYCFILDNLLSEIMFKNKIVDLYDEGYRLNL